MYREWDVEMRWAPFLLDPSIPPEGRVRTPQTTADTPKSNLELMGERRFRSGVVHLHYRIRAGAYTDDAPN